MQYLEPQPQPTETEFEYKKHRSRERPMTSPGSLPCKKGESQQHPAVQNQRLSKISTWFTLFYSLSTLTKKGLSKAHSLMFRNIRILWKAGSFSCLQCDHHTKSLFQSVCFLPCAALNSGEDSQKARSPNTHHQGSQSSMVIITLQFRCLIFLKSFNFSITFNMV